MKLVQLLAKELKEWPEGVTNLTQSEVDYEIYDGLDGNKEDSAEPLDEQFYASRSHSEGPYPMVTRDQWQAEREKMNKPKWIRHRGGKCPVKAGTKVVTRYRDGVVSDWCMTRDQDTSEELLSGIWTHSGGETDIMAYYVEETKDQEIEEVKAIDTAKASTIEYAFGDKDSDPKYLDWKQLGTLTYKLEIDATEANKEIDSLVAKWGQIESPLKWRDEIIELEAYEEEFRREREKMIRKLESEGFKLIDHMTPVYGEQIIDMSDWRNWKVGDIIEVVATESSHNFDIGEEVVVSFIDNKDADLAVKAEYKDGRDFWWLAAKDGKFIRRP